MTAGRFPLRAQIAAATALLVALAAGCGGGHPHKAAASAGNAAADGDGGTARELSFRSGPDTLPATLLSPSPEQPGRKLPGALIISGSGPTDRNGNDPQLPHLDANRNFARALSAAGVASLRYDKLGSGAAGVGAHPGGSGVGFDLFAQEALDAYRTLARRLGPSLPVLVLRGTKDVQVDASDIDHLMQGFAADRAAHRADIPDADHLFKVVTGTPNPAVDYANASRPFAPQVAPRLASFLAPLK